MERLAALAARLPAVLSGADRPANAGEGTEFGKLAYLKAQYDNAARLYAEAFAADPRLADDLDSAHRYDAACGAAMAGCGQGKNEPAPDEAGRAKLRRQALDWLKADLVIRARSSNPESPRPGSKLARNSCTGKRTAISHAFAILKPWRSCPMRSRRPGAFSGPKWPPSRRRLKTIAHNRSGSESSPVRLRALGSCSSVYDE